MPTIRDVLCALESIAPARCAFPWDKIGLQVGSNSAEVRTAVVSLDRSIGAVEFAAANDAQLLLSHHPLIFDALGRVTDSSIEGQTVIELISKRICFIAAHTNWDAAPGGINDALARILGLSDIASFGSSALGEQFKLIFFAPEASVDAVLDACSNAGAGQIGNYSRCAYLSRGMGTYEAGAKSRPTIGCSGERSLIEEVRVEMICPGQCRVAVETALRDAHVYEQPAFDFLQLDPVTLHPMGRIGVLPQARSLAEFSREVEEKLATKCWTWGNVDQVSTVAVVGGAADSEWRAAKNAGADVLVTGEVKQHIALEAASENFALIAAGHYATEQPGCVALAERMGKALGGIQWLVYEPDPGTHGRPQ
ncbi:MAG: Nif3-like dinuclear metal center hexameric protein [Fimbriimonadaceae bacterium]|nr:Nif3-like dinuclear metal center hexameric protein [Fimbriimonadaceae bacterium]